MQEKHIFFSLILTKAELLALTYLDVNLEEKTISINKSYQRFKGKDLITQPKTPKSIRVITIPDFLVGEFREYFRHLYGIMKHERLFHFTKSYMEHCLISGIERSGVKRIRLHDLRHPYVKHTTKNISLQKQKSQTTNSNLIVWVFCFRVLFLMPLALVGKC